MKLQISVVRFRVNLLGTVALAAYGVLALLSFIQTPALWASHAIATRQLAFFDDLVRQLPIINNFHIFKSNEAVLVSYFVPLTLATAATIALVFLLQRYRDTLDATVVALIRRWSIAFAVVSCFAFPIFTQDFWLSAVWGRMVAAGLNPYHQLFTPELLRGLPVDHFPMLMSYGPGWALISGAVMAIAGASVLTAGILFKAILGAAWIAAVVLVEKIVAPRPMVERGLALAWFGWLPIGLLQSVAEGHNDIVMAAFALLWFYLLPGGRWHAPVALTLSVVSKYVTAPLFLVDVIAAWRMQRLSWQALVLRYVAPGLLGLAVVAVFYRSPQFFEGTRVISEWHFLQPRHAILAFDRWIPATLVTALEFAIAATFAGVTAHALVASYKQPTMDNMAKAALAIMSTISFAGVAHLWPWYVVWTLALAALVPTWWLSRFVIGVAILVPFTLAFWWINILFDHQEWAAVGLYVGALLWVALTRRRDGRQVVGPSVGVGNRDDAARSGATG